MDDPDRTAPRVGPVVSEVTDIVRHALDEAGIVVAPDELEMLVAAYETILGRAASLYLPEAASFEPADVFLAGDTPEEGK
jgi:hypothetical protein